MHLRSGSLEGHLGKKCSSFLLREMNIFGLLHLTVSAALPHLTQLLSKDHNARGIVFDALFAPYAKEAFSAPECIILRCRQLGCIQVVCLGCGRCGLVLNQS